MSGFNFRLAIVLLLFSCITVVVALNPSRLPSRQPLIKMPDPTIVPSGNPTLNPTRSPTAFPSRPSRSPTFLPTFTEPTQKPSFLPTQLPSLSPLLAPTFKPTIKPTFGPSKAPSLAPTKRPSVIPTSQPTDRPSRQPSAQPSSKPSRQPSIQPSRQPSGQPSQQPTSQPTTSPSKQPSSIPTCHPSMQPSSQPSSQPSRQPSSQPSRQPSINPTGQPTEKPTCQPSSQPSAQPSSQPSIKPTMQPSVQPSASPSMQPTSTPTVQPSGQPSRQPSCRPSKNPSSEPSKQPSIQPTRQPSIQPSTQPSSFPSQPSTQPSALPTAQPFRIPTGNPSPKPTIYVKYNHTQRYTSFGPKVFDYYTAIWKNSHESWVGVDYDSLQRTGCNDNVDKIVFPSCVDGIALDAMGGRLDNSCPEVQCYPAIWNGDTARPNDCLPTPQDTTDYIPPPPVSSLDNPNICLSSDEKDSTLYPPYYGMNEGIPPNYLPVNAPRLRIFGQISGSNGNGKCSLIPGARIDAWQLDPTKLSKYSANSELLDGFNDDKDILSTLRDDGTQKDHKSTTMKVSDIRDGLRALSCRGNVVARSTDASFEFFTIMPPPYGPPRHVMISVSAPGYENLTTRMYFGSDWRLNQLTVQGSNRIDEYTRWKKSLRDQQHYTTRNRQNITNKDPFPGVIASDPRVVELQWIARPKRLYDIPGTSSGHFDAKFDIVLRPIRPNLKDDTGRPPMDINGLWGEKNGGLVLVETKGNSFWASEYPHARSWGSVAGILSGDTVRGISFNSKSIYLPGSINLDGSILISEGGSESHYPRSGPKDPSIWTASKTSGVIISNDAFNTAALKTSYTSVPKEISIVWTGGGYKNEWSKQSDYLSSKGYRYLKLEIRRSTGGMPGGVLVINEIEFFSGVFGGYWMPTTDFKMKTPRFPVPQMVTCSSFSEQDMHCFKAFDGVDTSNSSWVTKPVGSGRDDMLSTAQWILIDFGPGRGILPSAMRLVCGAGDPSNPKGCPKTFYLYGSEDNVRFDLLYSKDFFDYNNEYSVAGGKGKVFHFLWESPTGRADGSQCGSCDMSPRFTCNLMAYDGTCQSKYCNEGGFCGHQAPCRAGEYMDIGDTSYNTPSFECKLCAPGRFGNESGISIPYCSGLCAAGYFCPAGSTSATQEPCIGSHVYCPEGSAQPLLASAGHKTISKNRHESNLMVGVELCDPGHYCINGVQIQCPIGTFGLSYGLATSSCTDMCLPGEYCPVGSVEATICPKGSYCPDGIIRVLCPAGVYGAIAGLRDRRCSGTCRPGYYCDAGSVLATSKLCPAGSFGSVAGLPSIACSGLCEAGYFCPAGSLNSTAYKCGNPNVYCPIGSALPQPVLEGYYSMGGAMETRVAQIICESGFYCSQGLKYSCPPGTFNPQRGLSDIIRNNYVADPNAPTVMPSLSLHPTHAPSDAPTSDGSISPTTETDTVGPTVRYTGHHYEDVFSCAGFCEPGYYCPSNSSSSREMPCPPGRYGNIEGLGDSQCTNACPMGHYCPAGTVKPKPCRAGIFGNTTGLTNAACSPLCLEGGCDESFNACQEGHYCPKGSISATQYMCGDASVFCPTGSSSPTTVSKGYYTIGPFPHENSFTRTSELICPVGHYCTGGVKRQCPPGTFGATEGISDKSCSGLCPKGFYCPVGSYNGTLHRCPAGRYGQTEGLYSSSCSGSCSAGYYCPEASTSSFQHECGIVIKISSEDLMMLSNSLDLNFMSVMGLNNPVDRLHIPKSPISANLISAILSFRSSPDFISEFGSDHRSVMSSTLTTTKTAQSIQFQTIDGGYIDATHPRGTGAFDINELYSLRVGINGSHSEVLLNLPNSVICPKGSSRPLRVLPGYYSVNSNMTTRSDQRACPLGSYCQDGVIHDCPAGRYGRAERLTNAECTGICQKGHYCPSGSTSMTQKPCPAGRFGAVEGLQDSYCSGSCVQPLQCPAGSVLDSNLPTSLDSRIW